MKFAYIIRGDYDYQIDRAVIHEGKARIIGVRSVDEACLVARELCAEGVGCIELCGAFHEEGARQVIDATGNKIPIGYVAYLPEQDEIFKAAFPKLK